MNHKQQKQWFQQQIMNSKAIHVAEQRCDDVVNMFMLNTLIVLGDKFDFTKEQMVSYMKYLAVNSADFQFEREHNGVKTKPEDLKEVLKDDYELDYDKVVSEIYNEYKEGLKERQ